MCMWPAIDKKRRIISVRNKKHSWKALAWRLSNSMGDGWWCDAGVGGEVKEENYSKLVTVDTFDKMFSN